MFALQVPQRTVNRADRLHHHALAPMNHHAVHAIPDALNRQRIVADQHRAKLFADKIDLILGNGAADAINAAISLDADKVGGVAVDAVTDFGQPTGTFCFVFGIDINGADQPLLPKFALMVDRATYFEHADVGNLHGFLLHLC